MWTNPADPPGTLGSGAANYLVVIELRGSVEFVAANKGFSVDLS